jgi:hypothetical protein
VCGATDPRSGLMPHAATFCGGVSGSLRGAKSRSGSDLLANVGSMPARQRSERISSERANPVPAHTACSRLRSMGTQPLRGRGAAES